MPSIDAMSSRGQPSRTAPARTASSRTASARCMPMPIALAALALLALPLGPPVRTADAQPPQPVVETTEGPVVGVVGDATTAWKGVPFAAPPVGPLRWRAPRPPAARDAPLDASRYGAACPQDPDQLLRPGDVELTWAEDCLTLNIWAPNDRTADAALPVMVWIHGGGLTQGSGVDPLYDGADLAAAGDVVVVTINYRLGALGFLAHEAFIGEDPAQPGAGNYGLLDQIAALDWVAANIAGFGGSPDNVTVFGESAGGVSTCALMASPQAAGRFHRAIMQSGSCRDGLAALEDRQDGRPPATEQGRRFAEAIGCADTPEVLACLRAKPVDEVLATLPGTAGILRPGERYDLNLDGHALTADPADALAAGATHDVPFALGANADEGTVFAAAYRDLSATAYAALVRSVYGTDAERVLAAYPAAAYDAPWLALAAVTGDGGFVCPARHVARQHTALGRSTYLYHFTYVSPAAERAQLGAFHGAEIPFVFGNLQAVTAERRTLRDAMQTYWTTFARTGRPGAHDGLAWPAYDTADDAGLQLDTTPAVARGWRSDVCDLWDDIADRTVAPAPPTATPGATPPATVTPQTTPSPTATSSAPGPAATIYLPRAVNRSAER